MEPVYYANIRAYADAGDSEFSGAPSFGSALINADRLVTTTPLEEAQLVSRVSGKKVIIYVHGWRNTFSQSVLGGKEILEQSGGGAVVIVFSWPSATKYSRAERNATSRHNHTILRRFITILENQVMHQNLVCCR